MSSRGIDATTGNLKNTVSVNSVFSGSLKTENRAATLLDSNKQETGSLKEINDANEEDDDLENVMEIKKHQEKRIIHHWSQEVWTKIIQNYEKDIGSLWLFLQYSTWVSTENHVVTLAFSPQMTMPLEKKKIQEAGKILAQHIDIDPDIRLVDWQENFETVMQTRQKQTIQSQQEALTLLAQDKTAQAIIRHFGGQWQPEKVQLRTQIE